MAKTNDLAVPGGGSGPPVPPLDPPMTNTVISFVVTAKLVCAFVFAYADCWFSYAAA